MSIAPSRSQRPAAAPTRQPTRSSWHLVLRVAAVVTLAVIALLAVLRRDVEAAAVAGGLAVAFGLLFVRGGLAGQLLLPLMLGNTLLWMSLGAATNIAGGDGVTAVLVPAALTASTATGLVAGIAVLAGRRGREPSARAALTVAAGGALAFVALLVAAALTGGWSGATTADVDLALVSENVTFSDTELAADTGQITVSMANRDLFWHTFTIEELAVNLNVPVNGERQVTFTAAPGSYEFICRIPGHADAGMRGTLVVR